MHIIFFSKSFWTRGKRMRSCCCFQSPRESRLSGPQHRGGLRKGELCVVCVKDQTLRGWDFSQRDTLFLSGCCRLGLLCGSVRLYRLKTSGFSSEGEQCSLNSPNSYLTRLVDPNVISWGDFWGRVLFPTVQPLSPYPALGGILVLKFGTCTFTRVFQMQYQ